MRMACLLFFHARIDETRLKFYFVFRNKIFSNLVAQSFFDLSSRLARGNFLDCFVNGHLVGRIALLHERIAFCALVQRVVGRVKVLPPATLQFAHQHSRPFSLLEISFKIGLNTFQRPKLLTVHGSQFGLLLLYLIPFDKRFRIGLTHGYFSDLLSCKYKLQN